MSSERDPLLATSPQHHANVQDLEEAREAKKLGPLEISRSNRWAILGGIWIANFLCVRCAAPCLTCFSERPGTPVFEQCVHKLFLPRFLIDPAAFSYLGGDPYVARPPPLVLAEIPSQWYRQYPPNSTNPIKSVGSVLREAQLHFSVTTLILPFPATFLQLARSRQYTVDYVT